MAEIPASSNFFACITSATSLETVGGLYRSAGWNVRKAGSAELEVTSEVAGLVIEGDPVLVHGCVADPVANADAVTKPLRDAGVRFFFECYGPDNSVLVEAKWDPPVQR